MNGGRSEEHTSELQSRRELVCRLLLEKKKKEARTSQTRTTASSIVPALTRGTTALDTPSRSLSSASASSSARAREGASFFFFNDTATTEIYTLSLHDALPI